MGEGYLCKCKVKRCEVSLSRTKHQDPRQANGLQVGAGPTLSVCCLCHATSISTGRRLGAGPTLCLIERLDSFFPSGWRVKVGRSAPRPLKVGQIRTFTSLSRECPEPPSPCLDADGSKHLPALS